MTVKQSFEKDGVVFLPGLMRVDSLLLSWQKFYDPDRTTDFNKVAINGPFPEQLTALYRHKAVLDVMMQAFGQDIALYNFRFVVKDRHARDSVFLHQDTPYHVGWPQKASLFIAFTEVTRDNGGLVFYPQTHRYGYLGDAGSLLRPTESAAATHYAMRPGDAILMHSATWHESLPHVSGPDRVIADIIFQPASDPSGVELLRGQWRTKVFLDRDKPIFVRSRVSRIKELEAEVARLKAER